jgi:hypothetical protein
LPQQLLTGNLLDEPTSPNSPSNGHHYLQVAHQIRFLFPEDRVPAILDLDRGSFEEKSADTLPLEPELAHKLIDAAIFLSGSRSWSNPVRFPDEQSIFVTTSPQVLADRFALHLNTNLQTRCKAAAELVDGYLRNRRPCVI